MTTRGLEQPPDTSETESDEHLVALFAANVTDHPHSVAVDDGSTALTYAAMDRAANRLARRLADDGVRPGDRVVVAAHRSTEALVAMLGVLKAGAAFVPLDATDPVARQELVVADTGARVAVGPSVAVAALERLGLTIVALDPALRALEGHDDAPLADAPVPDDLAYVMYTSGSTGRPKGVAIEHRNVVRRVRGALDLMPRHGEGMLQVSKLDFDAQTWEIWGAWNAGARLVVVPDGTPDPAVVGRMLRESRVDVALLSPGLFRQVVEARAADLAGLRLLLVGGDVMSATHAARFVRDHPDVPLVNLYGPTEVTVCCTWHRVQPLPPGEAVPIGRPLGNTTLHLLDDDGRPVTPGAIGELYVGGDCVARGYLGLAEETASRFVPDPFVDEPAARMYRTGDRVRVRPDGDLEFLGRIDDQVKIRGYRIEPGEVEEAIRSVPGVVQTVVVAREDVPGHRRLVGYVVLEPDGGGGDARLDGVQAELEQRLPQHMIPSALVGLAELPLTSRGKVDRDALPAPLDARREHTHRDPTSDLERSLVTIWRQVLHLEEAGTEALGVDDDFVELGGDSLLAVRVLVAVQEQLGVELPLDAVFAEGTIARLARRIELSGRAVITPPAPNRARRSRPTPVTTMQAQACLITELAQGAHPYQFQAVLHLDGDLDVEILERALSSLVTRHEILRTRFARRGGTWIQIVEPPFEVHIPVVDLREAEDPEGAAASLAERAFAEPIGIEQLPLLRWRLARVSAERSTLLHAEHHLVHDGWSWGVFLDELTTTYAALAAGRAVDLPPPPVQFRDFAAWQHAFPETVAGRAQLDYWRETLRDLPPPLALPTDHPRPSRQSYRGEQVVFDLGPERSERLREFSAARGTTLFMTTLAGFAATLSRYSGAGDIVIGSGVANRRFREVERLIGMLVNTVALRVDLADDPTVDELLARTREATLGAMANQDLPFEHVLEGVAPRRTPGTMPVYQVLFSFQDPPNPDLGVPGLIVTPDDTSGNGSAKADLNVVVINRRGETPDLTLVWEYSTDLFTADTARRMIDAYLSVLDAMLDGPGQRVSELALVGDEERTALIESSGQVTEYERDASIVDVFADRVRETPDTIAVVAADGTEVTYSALDRESNRLAHRLRANGAVDGRAVAIVIDRAPEAIVAVLAALKAGSPYVAIEPTTPTERIRLLISDASTAVVCTTTRRRDLVEPLDDPGTRRPIVVVDDPTLQEEDPSAPAVSVGPLDVAYVAYTSGTSGAPKGVAVPHRAVVRLVRGVSYAAFTDETLLCMAPLAFDASTFEIWGALLNGARLAVAPEGPLSPDEIAEVVERLGVTTMWLTAGLFHQVVDRRPDVLAHLHQLLAGGDVLSPEHVARALRALPAGGALVNGYGPTEATTFTCCHRMPAHSRGERPVPIGRPIENTRVYVVDAVGAPVPTGLPGELWIGGDGLALGYLGDHALTNERFVPDPFLDTTSGPAHRCYRTGDRVRRRRDGTIEFLGRMDRQAKIRGFRVEPAAVERALLEHPDVAEVVVATPRVPGTTDRRLVAYVVPRTDALTIDELRSFLQRRLPAPEVPAAWVLLAELPLTENGKVDHDALPEPGVDGADDTVERPATPGGAGGDTELERELVAIWEDVLAVRPITPTDDFFDLGGHSLLAIDLFARVEQLTGVRLPLASIFDAPTVRQLAALLESNGWDAPGRSLVALTETGTRPPMFFVTAGDGNSVGFGALARRLGPDQPFTALQPRGLDGRRMLHTDVAGMAEHNVAELRRAHPIGPYVLGGRCFGTLIAYEMARLLEAAGQEVTQLVALDSVGPLWRERDLANGIRFDEVMNLALLGACPHDRATIFTSRAAADGFVAWLREPDPAAPSSVVTRYLATAYRARPDLEVAFPLADPALHQALVDWGHIGGVPEMGMNPELLPPPTEASRRVPRAVDPRHRSWSQRAKARAGDALDVATRGRSSVLGRRRARRLLELAAQMVLYYRAGPVRAPITLVRSEEYRDDPTLARWFGLETGGVTEVYIDGTHESMMREPDVASLAVAVARAAEVRT